MPHLSALTRRKLKYLPQAGASPHGAGLLACWNWALTGFGPTQNNPDELFNFVSFGIPYNTGGGVAWYNVGANQNSLAALRNAWAPFNNGVDSVAARAEQQRINVALTKLSCELNGLTTSPGATPYEVVMHYEILGSRGALHGPNWTHWWLRVDGGGAGMHNDAIEVFPRSPNLTIRRPEYSVTENCRIFVTELHQAHVTRIDNVVAAVIAANHNAIPHNPWIDTNNCAICNTHVTTGVTRHHCRCCGRTVCADCSPTTRAALLGGRAPAHKVGKAATNPPHRVCMYC
jgi:FYVE-type zinc finger protein